MSCFYSSIPSRSPHYIELSCFLRLPVAVRVSQTFLMFDKLDSVITILLSCFVECASTGICLLIFLLIRLGSLIWGRKTNHGNVISITFQEDADQDPLFGQIWVRFSWGPLTSLSVGPWPAAGLPCLVLAKSPEKPPSTLGIWPPWYLTKFLILHLVSKSLTYLLARPLLGSFGRNPLTHDISS